MIKVAIIHPSFGRPQQAFNIAQEWMNAAIKPEEVEYLVGLDDNDSSIENYKNLFNNWAHKFGRIEINVGNSRNLVTAINRLATRMSGTAELIIGVADDMAPCPKWDEELFKRLDGINPFEITKFIGVFDGLRDYGIALLYLIVTRAWYTRLGYLLYPEYDGVFADSDMHEVAKRLGAIIHAPELLFQHRHYSIHLSEVDATYARNNNPEGSARNLKIFNARAARNFDL